MQNRQLDFGQGRVQPYCGADQELLNSIDTGALCSADKCHRAVQLSATAR